MINEYVLRYIYYIVLYLLILYADNIIDHRRRLSKIIRIIVYVSPWIILPLLSIWLDFIGTVFLFLATLGSITISLYSEGYLKIMFGKISTLQIIIDATLVSLIIFFTSQGLAEFVIMWIIVEIMGSLLVLLERGMKNFNIIMKYLVVCVTAGDISLFLLLALTTIHVGFDKMLLIKLSDLPSIGINADPLLTILLLIGFTTKLAQIPLHFWLIDTYTETPSPGTAIFSGLMSKMAIYGILRIYYLIGIDTNTYTYLLLIEGILTTLYGFFMTSIYSDIKKIMSYSSMGHYGVMVIVLSLLPYNEEFYTKLLLLYVLYHGIVKMQTFLNISTIELLTNTRDIYKLGYLAQVANKVYRYSIITFLSLIGIPPTLGFYVKTVLLISLFMLIPIAPLISILVIICIGFSSVFSILYSVKYLSIYTASFRSKPIRIAIPLTETQIWSEVVLGVASLILTPMCLLIGVNRDIDLFVGIIYGLSILAFILAIVLRRRLSGKEAKVWVGGVEI